MHIPYSYGSTNTPDGLKVVRNEIFGGPGNRRWAPDILILITDGSPNINVRRTVHEATKTKQQVDSDKKYCDKHSDFPEF